ncbi:MAG: hypothetical protein O3A85_10125 [Proteobacteria bacterium]|nr:hypothetical protein [Pseudomonadota bacterium]
MPIFDSAPLTAGFVLSILAIVPYYVVLGLPRFQITERRHVLTFFWVWLALYAFEYYFLGPYSFIEKTGEGNLNVTLNNFLVTAYDGGRFIHEYGGGQDAYTVLFGKHFYNPYRMIAALAPAWVAILTHKLMIGALGFGGAYLLASRFAPGNRLASLAIAAVFPFTHIYLLNYSTNWSPGFSVLPVAAYLIVARSTDRRYWWGVVVAALFTTAADPIHIFPALAAMLAGTALFMHPVNYRRIVGGFAVLVACSVLNWHEVIYAFTQTVPFTSRFTGSNAPTIANILAQAINYSINTLWLPLTLIALAMIGLARRRDALLARAGLVAILPIAAFIFESVFPWHTVGLAFINDLSHYYLLIAIVGLSIPIAAHWLGGYQPYGDGSGAKFLGFRPATAVLAIALGVFTWTKFLNFGLLIWFGGQSALIGYENLKNNTWKPTEYFRVVTPFEKPNANIVAGFYGLDTFDAQTNMNYSRWNDYWKAIVRYDPSHALTTRIGVKWALWDGKGYAIEDNINLDLLGIANVRFILSALPLKADGLKLVFQPGDDDRIIKRAGWFPKFQDFLKFRIRRIFDPGEHFIYELPKVLPRVFVAQGVVSVNETLTNRQRIERVLKAAPADNIVVNAGHAAKLPAPGEVSILKSKKVRDGFDVDVAAPDGGVIVINTPYLPFWQAVDHNGTQLDVVPANVIHMAVAVPPGTKNIKVRYNRSLLREKLATRFSGNQ